MGLSNKSPIRVVFLLFYFEAWDSLASIYAEMRRDKAFEPIVVTIPRKLTGDAGYGGEALVHEFLVDQNVPHIRLKGSDYARNLERLQNLQPDYIFLNYPWQRNYPPVFRIDNLVKFTKIAYVPYFLLPLVDEVQATPQIGTTRPKQSRPPVAEHLFEQRTHQLASLVFCQDAATREAFASTERGNSYVFATGSPKLDALRSNAAEVRAAIETRDQKRLRKGKITSKFDLRILWAPHHSYSPAWLNFGMFMRSYQEMLAFARQNPRVKITLRPHPFLMGTLVDREVISKDHLESWLADWNSLPNTRLSKKARFIKQFLRNDYLLTDGISFLAEYPLLTGKPAFFLENPEHWQFNEVGEVAADCNIRVANVEEFTNLIRNQRDSLRESKDFSQRIERLRQLADPNAGQTAAVICKIVLADFQNETELVDATSIKTPAWENRPGREPQAD